MANIREYTSKENLKATLNPQDAVNAGNAAASAGNAQLRARIDQGEATAGLGRVLGGAVKDLGEQYQEHAAQEEISRGLATSAQILQNTTTAANNAAKNADPNDPSWGTKFQEEELEPILQSFASGFETKRGKMWAEAQVGAMRGHFFEKITADQSTLAGVAAKQNLETAANSLTQTVQQDPSALALANGTAEATVEGILQAHPNLSVSQIAALRGELLPKLQHDITFAASQAKARANPEAFMQQVADGKLEGKEHLDAGDNERLFGFAQELKRANEHDALAAQARQKAEMKDQGDAFLTKTYAEGIQPDGTWIAPPGYAKRLREAASAHPEAFSRPEVDSAIGAMEHATKLQIDKTLQRSDPSTYEQFRQTLGSGINKIAVNQAYADGKLSTDDWRMFLTAAEDARADPSLGRMNVHLSEFLDGMKSTITKSNAMAGAVYAEQDQRFKDYQSMVRTTVEQAVKHKYPGASTPDEAAFTYLDPRGAKYLGTLAPRYQLPAAQMDAATDREGFAPLLPAVNLTSGGGPRKPGETPQQYLKRTGG